MIRFHLLCATCSAALLSSCSPTNTGGLDFDDLAAFRDDHGRICSRTFLTPHRQLLTAGRVQMRGQYRLDLDPRSQLVELGRIEVEIDFSDRTESPPRTFTAAVTSVTFSDITGFTAISDEVGVGWIPSYETNASVTITEPVTPDRIPAALNISVKGGKTQISPDGSPGATRRVNQTFAGRFVQEFELGLFPFTVCGTIDGDTADGEFYLERI